MTKHELQQMMIDDIDRLSFFIDDILQANQITTALVITATWINPKEMIDQVIKRTCSRHHIQTSLIKVEDHFNTQIYTERTALEMVFEPTRQCHQILAADPNVHCVLQPTNGNLPLASKTMVSASPSPPTSSLERFFRAPGEAVNNRSGTGLGLYVAAQLVPNLGEIKSSDGFNQGPFYISLPNTSPRFNP